MFQGKNGWIIPHRITIRIVNRKAVSFPHDDNSRRARESVTLVFVQDTGSRYRSTRLRSNLDGLNLGYDIWG